LQEALPQGRGSSAIDPQIIVSDAGCGAEMNDTIYRVNSEVHVVNESKNGCFEDGPDISVGLEFNGAPDILNRTLQAFPCGDGCPLKSSGSIRANPASSSLDTQFGRLGHRGSLPSVMPSGLLPCMDFTCRRRLGPGRLGLRYATPCPERPAAR
jgi:hypothetical protein